MLRPLHSFLAVIMLGGLVGSPVHAADQTILGKSITLKNTSTPAKRAVVIQAIEKASPNTIVGNPTVSGATLILTFNGTNPSTQTFSLPQGTAANGKPFWSGDAVKGFKYLDALGVNSAIKVAQIKKTPTGTFQIKITGTGKFKPINVTPPNVGTNSCVFLALGGGDSYSVKFASLDGQIKNVGALLYSQKNPSSQGSCLPGSECSPNCSLGTPCSNDAQCVTGSCNGGVCKCQGQNFDYGITATVSATLRNWPGGSSSFGGGICGVTVLAPSANISNLSGDTWAVSSTSGFSSCGLNPQVPTCNTVGATASVLGNGRPYCSNSSDVFASGPSTAHVFIGCNP